MPPQSDAFRVASNLDDKPAENPALGFLRSLRMPRAKQPGETELCSGAFHATADPESSSAAETAQSAGGASSLSTSRWVRR